MEARGRGSELPVGAAKLCGPAHGCPTLLRNPGGSRVLRSRAQVTQKPTHPGPIPWNPREEGQVTPLSQTPHPGRVGAGTNLLRRVSLVPTPRDHGVQGHPLEVLMPSLRWQHSGPRVGLEVTGLRDRSPEEAHLGCPWARRPPSLSLHFLVL